MTIINLDLVIPAVLENELLHIKALKSFDANKDALLSSMTITPIQIMNYAIRMKSWGLGGILINFDAKDALFYLKTHPEYFEESDFENIFFVKSKGDREKYIDNLIIELTNGINYPTKILSVCCLTDIKNTGNWIPRCNKDREEWIECSKCGYDESIMNISRKRCPKCGSINTYKPYYWEGV